MKNWYEITMSEEVLKNEFEKMVMEEETEPITTKSNNSNFKRELRNSWVRKDKYRKKMIDKFLSLNPGMSMESVLPLTDMNCVWLIDDAATNGGTYSINHVTHVYMTPRGHVEQFRGALEWVKDGSCFGIGRKNRDAASITNRRIRHMKINYEDACMKYSDYKKGFAPRADGII